MVADSIPEPGGAAAPAPDATGAAGREENTSVRVIFFSDMKGSTTIKQDMAEKWDEHPFQRLRRQHDALLTEIISRDRAGEVIKSTGDGFLALFHKPSTTSHRRPWNGHWRSRNGCTATPRSASASAWTWARCGWSP